MPYKSKPPCFHHIRDTRDIVCFSASIHSSSIGRVTMYWTVLLWCCRMYISTSSSHDVAISASKGGYSYLPSVLSCCCIPAKMEGQPVVETSEGSPYLGVITQVSNTNKRVSWTTPL